MTNRARILQGLLADWALQICRESKHFGDNIEERERARDKTK